MQAVGVAVSDRPQDDAIRLTFEIAGAANQAHYELPGPLAAMLLAELSRKVKTGSLAPISLSDIRPGKMIRVNGSQIVPAPDGSLNLKLFADFEDRHVEIPMLLTRAEAMRVLNDLKQLLT